MEKKSKAVFNLREAAAYLDISTPTLTALLRSGEIPCRRAGQTGGGYGCGCGG